MRVRLCAILCFPFASFVSRAPSCQAGDGTMSPQSGCRSCVGIVQKSEQWPLTPGHRLAAALEALGPEDSTAKTEIQAALQRAKAATNTRSPSSSVDSGCSEGGSEDESRPSRESFGSLAGLFWTGDRAREAAREPPLEKQIAECKEFIEGSQKRVAAETVSLEDARQRLARWQRVAVPTVPEEAAAGVANVDLLRAKLAEAEAENSRAGNDGQPRPPTLRPRGTAMPRFSSARRRAGVIRLEARQTHRSQGCPRIWDTERDSANDIHGGRWCRPVGRDHDHGDYVSRIPKRFCRGGRDSRYGLRGVRVGDASKPGPTPLSRLWRAGLGMKSSASRGSGEVEVLVSSDDDAHATEPAVSIRTWTDQSQEMTQETEPAPSLLPTWVDMTRGDEVEARVPGQGRPDPVRMEDEVDDVVKALERDLPVLSHTHDIVDRQEIGVDAPDRGTPRSVQDCGVESSDTEAHEPPGDMPLGVAMAVQAH